jgi:hypothetical protein
MNGVNQWSTSCSCYPNSGASVTMTVPASRISTFMFNMASSQVSSGRGLTLTFYSNSLQLPTGLEYVDDLGVTQSGYEA